MPNIAPEQIIYEFTVLRVLDTTSGLVISVLGDTADGLRLPDMFTGFVATDRSGKHLILIAKSQTQRNSFQLTDVDVDTGKHLL